MSDETMRQAKLPLVERAEQIAAWLTAPERKLDDIGVGSWSDFSTAALLRELAAHILHMREVGGSMIDTYTVPSMTGPVIEHARAIFRPASTDAPPAPLPPDMDEPTPKDTPDAS